jgi:DNA replication protein DnaC
MESLGNVLRNQDRKSPSATASESPSPEEEVCPICKGAGFVHPRKLDGNPDYSRVVPCKCRAEDVLKRKREVYYENCKLPENEEAKQMTFKSFKVSPHTREAFAAAKELAEGKGIKWLTLLGPVDQGKTHLAVAICRRWLERGLAARYAQVPLMLDELRNSYKKEGEESYQAKLKFLCEVPLLVLDDLGTEKTTDFAREKLYTIIDYRYIHALPLVVTLNKRLDEIPGDDEHRIASRLQRFEPGKVLAIEGQEYRLGRMI